jgi:hypothetical protein
MYPKVEPEIGHGVGDCLDAGLLTIGDDRRRLAGPGLRCGRLEDFHLTVDSQHFSIFSLRSRCVGGDE